jgi:hypothetical protein
MPVVDFRGVDFEHSLSSSDLAAAEAKIASAISAEKALHQAMVAEFQSGTPGHPAVSCYLTSEPVKLACAVQAGKKVPKRHRPKLETLLGIPSKLTLEKPLGEIDWLTLQPKQGNDFRITHDFGPIHRTGKQMVRRVVECSFAPKSFQFTFLGIQKPIVQVREAILAGGIHFATLDIKDHYGSFHSKKLAALLSMLPKAWVEYVVLSRHAVMKWKKEPLLHYTQNLSPTELLLVVCSGLPAGSICSPIIAAHSISMLAWPTSPVMLWNYADDFLLLAASASELQEGIEELTAAVGELPGGHFVLKKLSQGHAQHGLEFLGHRLTLKGNFIETIPSLANQEFIYGEGNKMGQRVTAALKKGDEPTAIQHVELYCARVKAWLAAFAECDEIAQMETTFKSLIKQEAWPLVIDIDHMMGSAQGEFEYMGDEYQYA